MDYKDQLKSFLKINNKLIKKSCTKNESCDVNEIKILREQMIKEVDHLINSKHINSNKLNF